MSPSRRFTSSADSRRKKRRRNVNFSPKISTSAKQQRTHTKNFGFDDIREGSQKSIASSRSHEKHPSTVSVKSLERRSSIFSTKSRERCTSNGTTSAGNASDVSPITTTKDALAAGKLPKKPLTETLRKIFINACSKSSDDDEYSGDESVSSFESSMSDSRPNSRTSFRKSKRRFRCPRSCCTSQRKGQKRPSIQTNTAFDLPGAVLAVAQRMKDSYVKRAQDNTRDHLKTIMHRVTLALHHYGMERNMDTESALSSEEVIKFRMPEFDVAAEREKRENRQRIRSKFSTSLKDATRKLDIMQDIVYWFERAVQDDQELDKEEQKRAQMSLDNIDDMYKKTIEAIQRAKGASRKLKSMVGNMLGGGDDSQKDDANKDDEGSRKEEGGGKDSKWNVVKKIVADLNDSKNWKFAAKAIVQETDDVIRKISDSKIRTSLKGVQKQFKMFYQAVDRKLGDYSKLENQFAERGVALNKVTAEATELLEGKKKDSVKLQSLESENEALWERLNELQSKIENSSTDASLLQVQSVKGRRGSVALPLRGGQMARANSLVPQLGEDSELAEAALPGVDQIRQRLNSVQDEALDQVFDLPVPHDLKMKGPNRRSSTLDPKSRRFSLASEIPDANAEEQRKTAEALLLLQKEKYENESRNAQIIKTLEDTNETLRLELSNARQIIEDQILRLNEVETELLKQAELEEQCEELEQVRGKLNTEIMELKQNIRNEKDTFNKKVDDLKQNLQKANNEIRIKEDKIAHQQKCLDTMTGDMQRLLDEKLELEQAQNNQTMTIEIEAGMSRQQVREELVPDDPVSEIMTPSVSDYRKSAASGDKNTPEEKGEGKLALADDALAHQLMAAAGKMLLKMKNEYETEIQHLRDYITKEQQRSQAEQRRGQLEHQKDIQAIHKASCMLLKAVNRFKGSIASVLERESLTEAAYEMRQIEPLSTDGNTFATSQETKQMLTKMAYSVTELLVSLEHKLTKALLNKRLEVKEVSTAKGFILKDLEEQMDKLRKIKESSAIKSEKLRRYEEKSEEIMSRYRELLHSHSNLQRELAPYRQLVEAHLALKREHEKAQQEFKDATKITTSQIEGIEKDKEELKRTMREQQTLITHLKIKQQKQQGRDSVNAQRRASNASYYINKEAQKSNMQQLDQAFGRNQISSAMFESYLSLKLGSIWDPVQNTQLDTNVLPFARKHEHKTTDCEVVKENYHIIAEVDISDQNDLLVAKVMREAVVKYKNNIRLTNYVNEMEMRIEEKQQKWELRKQELVEYRANVIMQLMDSIKAVGDEYGVLLIKPLCKTANPLIQIQKEGPGYHKDVNKQSQQLPLPGTIVGKRLEPTPDNQAMWQMPVVGQGHLTETPRIVDLDVNQWRRAAKSLLTGELESGLPKSLIPSVKLAKIKREHASKLTLPPIATLYPESRDP